MSDTNTCDKCGKEMNTTDLIWITAEDFVPKDGENVPKDAYLEYDALCEVCYLSILDQE